MKERTNKVSYNYTKFNTGRGWRFERTRETYTATESGNFRKKPDKIESETVNGDFYINFVQSIPWFNNRYFGETCRATWNYTPAGYIPTRIVTSKNGSKKYVDTFKPVE
jgi:hypothetical protein